MRNRLLSLLAKNKGKGSFRAQGNEILIYDIIVGSQWEADWMGGVSPEAVMAALKGMTGPVTVRINSPGGDVFGGRAIEQALREYGDVAVQVDGLAASAASVIACAMPRVVMAPGAMMMIHKAWSVSVGNADDMLSTAELLEKVDGTIAATYAAKSGKDPDRYIDMMAAETWFTADEAIAEGLVDAKTNDAVAKATWDLSAYARPPQPEPQSDPAAGVAADDTERRKRLFAARLVSASA